MELPLMLASLCYDVEDLVSPESDDVARWIAETLTDVGIRATFWIVGEKARLLRERGRDDVIEAMKRHEYGFHSTLHSIHPTIVERCEERSFLDALETLIEKESPGWRETEAVLGRRLIGWATTGGSWVPSLCGLMHQFGGVHAYTQACFGDHSVVWYGNCLNFGQFIGGWDSIYESEEAFRRGMERLDRSLDAAAFSSKAWVGVFGGHPTRVISQDFWDGVNFSKGANPPREDWKPQRFILNDAMNAAPQRFREFAARLRADDRFRFHSIGDIARQFDAQRSHCDATELRQIARRILDERRPLFTESFSAAEIAVMLSNAVLHRESSRFNRWVVFGPNESPPDSRSQSATRAQLNAIARRLLDDVTATGCLPSQFEAAGAPVTISQAMYGLATLVHEPSADRIELPTLPPYPPIGDQIADGARKAIHGWQIHPPLLELGAIEEAARLQAWTLKPAWHQDALPWG